MVKKSTTKSPVIIDTNVLLTDPYILNKFSNREILMPVAILKELDTFKKGASLINKNSRTVIRLFEKIRKTPVEQRNVTFMSASEYNIKNPVDDIIIEIAKNRGAKIISNDINVRVSATCENIDAEDYKPHKNLERHSPQLYKGHTLLRKNPFSRPENLRKTPNHYFVYDDDKNNKKICKFVNGTLNLIKYQRIQHIEGIAPLNIYQQMAMDALMSPEIEVVSLIGNAGTGKTLLALACGIQQCKSSSNPKYLSVSVGRAIVPIGRDIGALPGDLEDKIKPYLSPVYDNLEVLAEVNGDPYDQTYSNDLFDSHILSIQAFSFMRGRSINKKYLIIDEAQNLTHHEIKTIVTRAGKGTKIVFVGDPQQIDIPELNSENNGLTYLTEAFTGQKCFATVTLEKVERSGLADLAVKILK